MFYKINIKTLFSTFLKQLSGAHNIGDVHAPTPDVPGKIHYKLALDSINYFMSKIVPGIMGFLSVLAFVRLIGYEQYGRYAVVFAVVMAFASGMAGWLGQGILRFQSQCLSITEVRKFSRATTEAAILSILLGLVALSVIIPVSGVQKGWLVLTSLTLFAALLAYTVVLARFQAGLQSQKVLRFEVIRSLACFVFPVIIMFATGSRSYWTILVGIMLGYSFPIVWPSLIHLTRAHAGYSTFFDRLYCSSNERAVIGKLWSFGWPVALWILCQQGLLVSDRFFIQHFSGFADTGIYSSMYDVVVRSFSLLFMPVTLAVHPLVMDRWNSGNRREALAAIRSGVKYQLLMFVPIALVLVIAAPWVGRMVLGKVIPGATSLVLPLALGGFLWQTCLLAHKPLEILCQTKRMFAGMLLALTVNIAGNWSLVPRFGYKASAYLAIASSCVYLLSLLILTPRKEFRKAVESRQETEPATEECVTASL